MSHSVLVVCDYSPDFLGGAQTAMRNQLIALRDEGHRVTLVSPATRHPVDGVDHRVPRRLHLPLAGVSLARNSPRTRAWLRSVAEEVGADVVVVHSEFGLAAAALEVAGELGIPGLHTVHTIFWRLPVEPPRPLAEAATRVMLWAHSRMTGVRTHRAGVTDRPIDDGIRGITASVAEAASIVVSPSAHQASTLESLGLPNVRTLSNVVADARPGGPWPADRPLRLVWAGRFSPEKAVTLALHAVLEAQRRLGPGRVLLDVAGDGPERDRVAEAASASSAIRWHGRLQPAEVAELIDRSHGVIISSLRFDNQPMIALEAFRGGRGVIVIDPVLAAEFGDAAVLAPGTDATALADLLVSLAHDPAPLRRAADTATEVASMATSQAHVARLLHLAALADDERKV